MMLTFKGDDIRVGYMSALHCFKRELVILLQGKYSFFFFGHTIKHAGSKFPNQVLNSQAPAVKFHKLQVLITELPGDSQNILENIAPCFFYILGKLPK